MKKKPFFFYFCQKSHLLLYLIILLIIKPGSGYSQVIINEIMPANSSFILDPTYNYGGWVELYNPGENDQSLWGHYLSDAKEIKKFKIEDENAVVPAKGFYIFWFDNNDINKKQVNFKLDCEGGELYLFDPNGKIIIDFNYQEQCQNTSFARSEDGSSEWVICTSPTPGKSNQGSPYSFVRCPEPEFSAKGGVFSNPVTVHITAPSSMEIRYTTDGSEPNENSNLWTGQKTFSETTILRARVCADGHIPGPILTQSFIFSDREFTLPVVSIVTDPKNLWDDEIGIYCVGTNGKAGGSGKVANFFQDWDRPANFELIQNNEQVFSQECDIAIGGSYSRHKDLKTLKLNAEKKYNGKNRFDFPFFKGKPGLRFKSFSLRNGGNDWHNSMMTDAMQQSLVAGIIDLDYQAYQPTVHFINGEYYGIINLRERNNHHYLYSNYGYNKEEVEIVKYVSQELEKLILLTESSEDPAVYKEIENQMDVDEFIAYLITEIYVGNKDWIDNNIKIFRNKEQGKWRWLLYDLDSGFDDVNINPFTRLNEYRFYTSMLYINLMENPTFKQRFIDYFVVYMGSLFVKDRVLSVIDSIADGIRKEAPYHQQRWHNDLDQSVTILKQFAYQRNSIIQQYVKENFNLGNPVPLKIESNLGHATLLMNDIEIPLKRLNGHIFKGSKIKAEAISPNGYKFEKWVSIDPETNEIIESFTDHEIVLSANSGLHLQAEFSKDTQFTPPVRINEISASNTIHMNEYFSKEDWIELYNTTDSPVSIGGMYLSMDPDNLTQYRIPEEPSELTSIPPYGYRILWADKKESLTQLHVPFKLPAQGGTLFLSCMDTNQNLIWTDHITYNAHDALHTFGRCPDGSETTYILNHNSFSAPNFYSIYNIESGEGPVYTSTKNLNEESKIGSYYNSSSTTLTFKVENGFIPVENLTIHNLIGHQVGFYVLPEEVNTHTINVMNLPFGYHIVTLHLSNGQKETFKFIK